MFEFVHTLWFRDVVDFTINAIAYGFGIAFVVCLLIGLFLSLRERRIPKPKETPMGAHSSLIITRVQARKIWQEVVQADNVPSYEEMEELYDEATDEALHNVCIFSDETTEHTREDDVRRYVERYLERRPEKRPASLKHENAALRQLLAIRVAGLTGLYTDDGELQDNSQSPAIDFKRDRVEVIRQKLIERATRNAVGT